MSPDWILTLGFWIGLFGLRRMCLNRRELFRLLWAKFSRIGEFDFLSCEAFDCRDNHLDLGLVLRTDFEFFRMDFLYLRR